VTGSIWSQWTGKHCETRERCDWLYLESVDQEALRDLGIILEWSEHATAAKTSKLGTTGEHYMKKNDYYKVYSQNNARTVKYYKAQVDNLYKLKSVFKMFPRQVVTTFLT